MILVSACLAGVNCKYDGNNNYNEKIDILYQEADQQMSSDKAKMYAKLGIKSVQFYKKKQIFKTPK